MHSQNLELEIEGFSNFELLNSFENCVRSERKITKVYSDDKIIATTLLGTVGGSKTLAGATDIDVKMNPDIFYCGAGKAAYSIIQFAKDCRKLQIATPFANCSPSARPKTLEANPFTKN